MQEWLNWPLSKSGKAKAFEGSNPSLSAMFEYPPLLQSFFGIMNDMEDSLFTKIINGEIPSHKIYEDDKTLAFLDVHPLSEGHVLVVPKTQVEFIWDLEADDYQALMATVQRVGRRLRDVMDASYVGVEVIGVDVPHAHVHVVPFSTTDQLRAKLSDAHEPDHDTLAALAEKIRF